MQRIITVAAVLLASALGPLGPLAPRVGAAPTVTPAAHPVDTWAWCGVHPDDPAAQASAIAMATSAGIDATFGPCNVPTSDYTPAFTANRYVSPALYMRLVEINAAAGMKTVVYDSRIWDTDPLVRTVALNFWQPVYQHIAAWDMGDEFDPTGPQWQILKDRWSLVLGDATAKSGIRPFANQLPTAVAQALADLPGSESLMSFAKYDGDLGASIATAHNAAVTTLMCGVNAFTHFSFAPTVASIRSAMTTLITAGCDQILVFGGARVYGSESVFGSSSLVDPSGAATTWAVGVMEGSGRSAYRPVGPARLLETRSGLGLGTIDGTSYALGTREPATVTELQITGRAGVPVSATAAVVNVTVTNTAANGYVTLFPCGSAQPLASQLNHGRGVTLSASATVKLSADGRLCAFNLVGLDLVVDIVGYFPDGSSYTPVQPARLLETRLAQPTGTIDGLFNEVGVRDGGTITELQVGGRAQVPMHPGAVALNVTVVDARGAGFITVYACDQPRPNASQVNFATGATITNSVIVGVSAAGTVCIYTHATVDLVVDVAGHHPAGASVVAVPPARVLETRSTATSVTVDGESSAIGRRSADTVTELRIGGRAGVPVGAGSVVLNVTITEPVRAGFVSVYACGSARPNAASVNFVAGQTVANLVVADLDAGGKVCVYTMSATQLVVDVMAYHP
ncbi:MAG: hypothetical protein RLZZ623_1117 [Actinomycetota bacterium]